MRYKFRYFEFDDFIGEQSDRPSGALSLLMLGLLLQILVLRDKRRFLAYHNIYSEYIHATSKRETD